VNETEKEVRERERGGGRGEREREREGERGRERRGIMNNLAETQARLQTLIAELESGEKDLNFECMHDWTSLMNVRDQRAWSDGMPVKMGIYHCFMRTNAQNEREHKVFIFVSGNCRHASEELYNLWLDARDDITVAQLSDGALGQDRDEKNNRVHVRRR
jgi:hypothetical protein